ncbi:hypothetical protein [Paraburkholderia metrosideri]|jgi:hypothetical protein|uniref:Uncharacterized protein n=1 Tax=Paraburkholderia metrosideri TaxID=580937 RepID=A0ABM8P220_9BURK|nr:hypothetical protein [Paraburkholderia metrosideri]CAD6553985.1 hypothetical protein LMG28140_05410 [Paraburkholderia metrosideri]
MSTQSYAPYRGCQIEVHVTPAKTHVIGGMARRYRVSWTVSSPAHLDQAVASFPEQFNFLSEHEAFRYGENRAHTFIDSILAVPVDSPMTRAAFEPRDDTRRV